MGREGGGGRGRERGREEGRKEGGKVPSISYMYNIPAQWHCSGAEERHRQQLSRQDDRSSRGMDAFKVVQRKRLSYL